MSAPRRAGHLYEALGRKAARQLPGAVGSGRCRPRRGQDLCLPRRAGRCRPEQQLGRPRRDARHFDGALPRLDAWPDDVRRALLHGPARLPDRPSRSRAHRLGLRGSQHADHDENGGGRARGHRRRRVRSLPALSRGPARSRRGGRGLALRPHAGLSSPISPRLARSGRSAPVMGATPFWARSASLCASPRSSGETKAGSQSTC